VVVAHQAVGNTKHLRSVIHSLVRARAKFLTTGARHDANDTKEDQDQATVFR